MELKVEEHVTTITKSLDPFRLPALYIWEQPMAILLKDPEHPLQVTDRDTKKIRIEMEWVAKDVKKFCMNIN
jgi:hypothetical protein